MLYKSILTHLPMNKIARQGDTGEQEERGMRQKGGRRKGERNKTKGRQEERREE